MTFIRKIPIPAYSLMDTYTAMTGTYTDCYMTEIQFAISIPEFVYAFYITPLFKLERLILQFTVSKPSTDFQARQAAEGKIGEFAAWTVEARGGNELLMCDFLSRTRSWFMTIPVGKSRTRLYFGTAVVPKTGRTALGFGFRAMLGFHQIYSVSLLYSAKRKLERGG